MSNTTLAASMLIVMSLTFCYVYYQLHKLNRTFNEIVKNLEKIINSQ